MCSDQAVYCTLLISLGLCIWSLWSAILKDTLSTHNVFYSAKLLFPVIRIWIQVPGLSASHGLLGYMGVVLAVSTFGVAQEVSGGDWETICQSWLCPVCKKKPKNIKHFTRTKGNLLALDCGRLTHCYASLQTSSGTVDCRPIIKFSTMEIWRRALRERYPMIPYRTNVSTAWILTMV